MSSSERLPRILIIDDLTGRRPVAGRNQERESLCGQLLITDVTEDQAMEGGQEIVHPIAEAVFWRGQTPTDAQLGDTVENDIEGVVRKVQEGWWPYGRPGERWAAVLVDLCFYTGRITEASERERGLGMPEGRPGDDEESGYFGLKILDILSKRFSGLPVFTFSSMREERRLLKRTDPMSFAFLPRSSDRNMSARLAELLDRHGLFEDPTGSMVGSSLVFLKALRGARRAAQDPGRSTVLIQGETGTGKELLARYIHHHTPSSGEQPFHPINTGGLLPDLYYSELFGHVRGAFTNATSDRAGAFELADGGTLFLDELGNMPGNVQEGLLRAVQDKEIRRLGATRVRKVDVRILSATNADLKGEVLEGAFREDLLHRLNEWEISLPPLRDRRDDIPSLVSSFHQELGGGQEIGEEAIQFLSDCDWPGNIRDLRNAVRRAVRASDKTFLGIEDFDSREVVRAPSVGRRTAPVGVSPVVGVSLADLERVMEEFAPADATWERLHGVLPRLSAHFGRVVMHLIERSLVEVNRGSPTGSAVEYTGALSHLEGEKLQSTAAADALRRLARIYPVLRDAREDHPLIAEALERADTLRAKKTR